MILNIHGTKLSQNYQGGHSDSFRINLVSFRTFIRSLLKYSKTTKRQSTVCKYHILNWFYASGYLAVWVVTTKNSKDYWWYPVLRMIRFLCLRSFFLTHFYYSRTWWLFGIAKLFTSLTIYSWNDLKLLSIRLSVRKLIQCKFQETHISTNQTKLKSSFT